MSQSKYHINNMTLALPSGKITTLWQTFYKENLMLSNICLLFYKKLIPVHFLSWEQFIFFWISFHWIAELLEKELWKESCFHCSDSTLEIK